MGHTSSNFGGNLTFENSSVFDENNNDKNFVGSKSLNSNRSSAQRLSRKMGVEHKGHDLREQYTLKIPTLFSTIRVGLESQFPTSSRMSNNSK